MDAHATDCHHDIVPFQPGLLGEFVFANNDRSIQGPLSKIGQGDFFDTGREKVTKSFSHGSVMTVIVRFVAIMDASGGERA